MQSCYQLIDKSVGGRGIETSVAPQHRDVRADFLNSMEQCRRMGRKTAADKRALSLAKSVVENVLGRSVSEYFISIAQIEQGRSGNT